MTSLLRLSALREQLRASLWFWPAVSVALAVVAGVLLPALEQGGDGDALGFAGSPEGARSVLATVAGSMITVTGLTFSLTVVALQMASSQFTPRILRTFLSDRGNQAVLSAFLATFAYSLAVLRSVRNPVDEAAAFVPDIAVSIGLGLTLLCVAMLVYFFHHLTQQLRVESVLSEVQRDTVALIERLAEVEEPSYADVPPVPDGATALPARRTGYLQAVDTAQLVRQAQAAGVSVRLRPVVGTHVTVGATVAWAWPSGGGEAVPSSEDLGDRVHRAIHIGPERTLQQDVAFGIRQLVDIAARALSPGVNDPTTAVATIHALASVLAALVGRRSGPRVHRGDDGTAVVVTRSTFAELLALACDQPRRYGRSEPAVLTELLRMLTDLAEVARLEDERAALRAQVEATAEAAADADLSTAERDLVRSLARHARAAVDVGARAADLPDEVEEPAS